MIDSLKNSVLFVNPMRVDQNYAQPKNTALKKEASAAAVASAAADEKKVAEDSSYTLPKGFIPQDERVLYTPEQSPLFAGTMSQLSESIIPGYFADPWTTLAREFNRSVQSASTADGTGTSTASVLAAETNVAAQQPMRFYGIVPRYISLSRGQYINVRM